jgi:DNA-binding NtrC family response regulator
MERVCLIVDDEPTIRAYLKAILHKEGYQTLEAENAPQAFRLVRKLNGGLNLVVSDVRMPGEMDGVDLAFAIRDTFPAIPVILVSGYEDTVSAKHPIVDFEFIQKPLTPEAILAAVNKATRLRHRTASS